MNAAAPCDRTIAGVIEEATGRLARAGVASPRLDARLLLAHILRTDQAALIRRSREGVDRACCDKFKALVERRAAREPVARILGEREFFGRRFAIAPVVLDPRPDSEILIETALELTASRADQHIRICDLGTGSGVLLVTLLAELRQAVGLGIDIDCEAVEVARANARRHGVDRRCTFSVGDWDRAIEGMFDLIVANPPYIDRRAIAGLEPEVRDHDPLVALDGGEDVLDAHRAVAAAANRLLEPLQGRVIVELGADQGSAVTDLFQAGGLSAVLPGGIKRDLAGRDRVFASGKA